MKKQTTMFDASTACSVTPGDDVLVDYTKMAIGTSPGRGMLISTCSNPDCRKPGVQKRSETHEWYVHSQEIRSDFKGTPKAKVTGQCKRKWGAETW